MEELNASITERRRLTRNSIYNYIYEAKRPPSKQEISQNLSLSLPTVYQNINELLKAELIQVGQIHESTGGRRPIGYSAVGNIKFAVGISITASKLHLLALDLKQSELSYEKIAIKSLKSDDIGKLISDELEVFLDKNRLDRNRLLGVGITLPGVLDEEKDEVKLSPTLRMRHISLNTIREPIPYPTYIENDGTSGGFTEWFESRNTVGSDIAYIYLDYGVGGTVFINGAQYFGKNKRSGEFGHMCVEPNGLLCNCGKKGCLEAYCSTLRISTNIGITLDEFFEGLQKGNPDYEALWDDVLSHMVIGINNIHMGLDCDIILGGILSQYLEPYMPELRRRIVENDTFEDDSEYVKLCHYPNRADTMGVALHFINEYLENI